MVEVDRKESDKGRFTLVFLRASGDSPAFKDSQPAQPLIELTYNWDGDPLIEGRNFGHLAFAVDNIYEICTHLQSMGIVINRPPRDGHMAFIRSPDAISIELLQAGPSLAPQEPWTSLENVGTW